MDRSIEYSTAYRVPTSGAALWEANRRHAGATSPTSRLLQAVLAPRHDHRRPADGHPLDPLGGALDPRPQHASDGRSRRPARSRSRSRTRSARGGARWTASGPAAEPVAGSSATPSAGPNIRVLTCSPGPGEAVDPVDAEPLDRAEVRAERRHRLLVGQLHVHVQRDRCGTPRSAGARDRPRLPARPAAPSTAENGFQHGDRLLHLAVTRIAPAVRPRQRHRHDAEPGLEPHHRRAHRARRPRTPCRAPDDRRTAARPPA